MSQSKSHHYVPRFYLARFADSRGMLWVLDKTTRRTYLTNLENVACVNQFYVVPELANVGLDPCLLERQFSAVESETAKITECWFRQLSRGNRVEIPDVNREIISQFLVLQMLRTVESRAVLVQLIAYTTASDPSGPAIPASSAEQRSLHASLLWDEDLVRRAGERIKDRIWIFGKNESQTSFCTSDQPVLIKAGDNRGWVLDTLIVNDLLGKHRYDAEDYIVFPLAPRWILYCYDRQHYRQLVSLDNSVSPVAFTAEMVNHENSGQIGMSHRYVYSGDGDFAFAKEYADEQPWIRIPDRNRFESHPNPYEGGNRPGDGD